MSLSKTHGSPWAGAGTVVARLFALLASSLWTASACQAPAAAEPPSAAAGQAVQAVVDDYVNALGGRDALLRIRNRRAEGVVEARRGAPKKSFRLYWSLPNLARAEFKDEDVMTYEGYDGAKGWIVEFFSIGEELKRDALEDLLLYADPIRYAHLLEIYPDAASETDPPDAAGRIVLRATEKGSTLRFFFDRKTHLLVELENGRDTDESPPRRYRFEQYRRVDGILFPFLIHEVMPLPNLDPEAIRIENLIRYKSVSHNLNMPATLFTQPK
jgi:hypothetical protein